MTRKSLYLVLSMCIALMFAVPTVSDAQFNTILLDSTAVRSDTVDTDLGIGYVQTWQLDSLHFYVLSQAPVNIYFYAWATKTKDKRWVSDSVMIDSVAITATNGGWVALPYFRMCKPFGGLGFLPSYVYLGIKVRKYGTSATLTKKIILMEKDFKKKL